MKEIRVKKLLNYWEKTKGLIGQKDPYPVLLQTRFGIHTFGLKFPIDAIITDNKNIIRKTKENLKPNKIYLWNPKYKTIIELPNGTIKSKNLKTGEKIKIIEE